MSFENWTEGLTDICAGFQLELSCLVDGELDEVAGARAMVHLEDCDCCRTFIEDTRRQVRLHNDMADPERLMARVAMLTGSDLQSEAESADLIHRLATIFYQLGKAYTLAAVDPGFRERIFEKSVPVDTTKTHGRGFVDGVVSGGRERGDVDWDKARHLLNGRLERIEDPLEKGRHLLEEALEIEDDHEEAKFYLAMIFKHEKKFLQAAKVLRNIFDTAVSTDNRVNAAVQLGRLYHAEDDKRMALVYWRWATMSGLVDGDDRFWYVRFNIGLAYAELRRPDRSLEYFRALLDYAPDRSAEVAAAFAKSPELRKTIDSQEGFAEALFQRCPELFHNTGTEADGMA